MKSSTITLQLVNRSLVKPKVMVEDVLIIVDKFILPIDLVILDIVEHEKIPIILGRPFLATGDVEIRVKKQTITFLVNCE